MQLNDFFKDLTERLTTALPNNLQAMKKDWEKNVHSMLVSAFSKLELVTREEFDTQTKVLLRTRKKLEAVEAKLKAMEDNIQDKG